MAESHPHALDEEGLGAMQESEARKQLRQAVKTRSNAALNLLEEALTVSGCVLEMHACLHACMTAWGLKE